MDETTANWFAGLLADKGGIIEKQAFDFDAFEHVTTLVVGGSAIDSLPLYYRCMDECDSGNLSVQRLVLDHEDGATDPIPDLCRQAVQDGFDALVLATGGPDDSLVAINRAPTLIGDLPVILIAGRDYEQVRNGIPHLRYAARISRKTAHNVIARFGNPAEANRVVMTTPLSGWFGCAGERGTGISVLLGLVENLRENHAFTVIGASGHELMYLGGEYAARTFPTNPEFVLHLGSCIATRDGTRDANLHAPSESTETVRKVLAPLSVTFRQPDAPDDMNNWVGESRCWAGKTKSMLSIAGISPDFHTPEDTPDRATSPEQLVKALNCVEGAFSVLRPLSTESTGVHGR